MMRFWLVMVLLPGLGACTHAFAPRVVPGCYLSAGAPELDRERSYYALLLALNERAYEILHAELPRQIEAAYHSDYAPQHGLTLVIDVRQDAALAVQSLPAGARVNSKQERSAEQLAVSLRRFMCRDLNWLRWEAQNRGLAPMAIAAQDFGAGGAGGEQVLGATPSAALSQPGTRAEAAPATPAVEVGAQTREPQAVDGAQPLEPQATDGAGAAVAAPAAQGAAADVAPAASSPPAAAPPPPQLSVSAKAVAARLAELRHERAQLSLRMPTALWITGGALAIVALGFAIPAFIDLTEDCDDLTDESDCDHERGQKYAIAAGSLIMGAGAFGITGKVLRDVRKRRLRRNREEMMQLTAPVIVGASFDRRGVNVSLRAAF